MRIAVYEDNNEHAQRLIRLIKQWAKSTNTEITSFTFNSVFETANTAIFDCILLDVEMPGMNGIDFIRSFLPKKRVPFIVITSSPTRAFDAISAGAVEFMKKPLVQNSKLNKFQISKIKSLSIRG